MAAPILCNILSLTKRSKNTRTKDGFLEILINERNQVDHKIVLGLGVGF
jgi:hypothetical protein